MKDYVLFELSLFLLLGEVAKWLNAADCKSVPSGSMVRIHLSPPLILPRSQAVRHHTLTVACASSNLAEATTFDLLAQSVEHLTFNQRVSGSNPEQVTIFVCKTYLVRFLTPEWRNR